MDKWEFYKDTTGKWRWRRIAPNGKVVGASTEGYVNKSDCESNARRNGWTIRDYRTARRVVKITAPALGAAGLVTGAAIGAVAARRALR